MLACQRPLFDLPEEIAYLNCAYMSPLLLSVTETGIQNIHKKARPFEIFPDDFFKYQEMVKRNFARLVNISNWERVAIIPSASYGVATVCRNLKMTAGQEILVASEQFPSNYYSWERKASECGGSLQIVDIRGLGSSPARANELILESISERTAAVALSHVHWADGLLYDLETIRRRTREVGAILVLDGTQSVGALPFDAALIEPDALICAGYKWLMGPYSLGCAYYGSYFDDGEPLEENWINRRHSENFAGLVDYESDYRPFASRYSVGESSNFILASMLNHAIEQLLNWGVGEIQDYCKKVSAGFVEQVKDRGGLVLEEEHRCGHLFGVRIPGQANLEALRNHCLEEKVFVSIRGDAVRISPHVYNTEEDFARLLSCFKKAGFLS